MKCLQSLRMAYVAVITETERRMVPRPYWLTVAAADSEELLENYIAIHSANGGKIRIIEKEISLE